MRESKVSPKTTTSYSGLRKTNKTKPQNILVDLLIRSKDPGDKLSAPAIPADISQQSHRFDCPYRFIHKTSSVRVTTKTEGKSAIGGSTSDGVTSVRWNSPT
ncbi:hypothetical protein BaRGS_00014460 [Batillaria attramentaria]|uniref:Uncharacterized protein n=1 Tax=Batillaria attramentaria TaxID=370345 RepID=A0ABD0L4M5_9CAEN